MAKNIGLIQFTGKLGGLSGRNTAFGNIIQTPGGFNGDRIRTEERYEKTRQLSTEFGRCAKLSSLFKRSLDTYLKTLPDPYVYNHIQKRMAAIKECDTDSPKGEKTVGKALENEKGFALLRHFSFNRKRSFNFSLLHGAALDLEKGTFTIPHLNMAEFDFPPGATMVGMQLVLLRVDFETAAGVMEVSEIEYVDKAAAADSRILNAKVPEGAGRLVAVLYVGFCSRTNGEVFWRRDARNGLEVVAIGE